MASDVTFLCLSCNRPTRPDTVYVTMWLGAELNVIEGVPAHVCDDCGVQYHDPEVEDKIRALTIAGFPRHLAINTIAVPVFSLDKIDAPSTVFQPKQARG